MVLLGPSCPGQARPRFEVLGLNLWGQAAQARPGPGQAQARPGRKISPSISLLKYSIPAIQNSDFLKGRRVKKFDHTQPSLCGSAAVHDPAYSNNENKVFSKKNKVLGSRMGENPYC